MLKIFADLKPFFEDNYKRISVREYSRIRGISAPTASTLLNSLAKDGLLKQEKERKYIFYHAEKDSKMFVGLSRIYWQTVFKDIKEHIATELIDPIIILFGSFSKAEINEKSDIDIAVFADENKKISLKSFEEKYKRSIQLFQFKTRKDIKNEELLENILNGYILSGSW